MIKHLALILIAGAAAAPASAQRSVELVRFDSALQQRAEFVGPTATVYDDDGKAVFSGSRDFVLKFAGSADAKVQEWDAGTNRVRISSGGTPAAWLACDELKPMAIACGTRLTLTAGNILTIAPRGDGSGGRGPAEDPGAEGPSGALPRCPGDPRCPKL